MTHERNQSAFSGMRRETMDEVEDRLAELRQQFPHSALFAKDSDRQWIYQEGMTLRDYFAAKAMPLVAEIAELEHTGPNEWAAACYEIADAMLKARQA